MADRDVPEDEPMEVNYFGEEDNLNVERINQMNVPNKEPLPMCDLVKKSDLGEVESLERDETDPELERIRSGAFGCIFLRVRLDGSTRALMSGHFLYEALRRTRPDVAQWVEEVRLIKAADRIPDICFDIIAHPFVLQPRFMLGPSLNEVTDILYENAPLGTLYKHVEGENTHFDDTTILQFACQLAIAIEYCHQKLNIMHRNINPKSIFVFQLATGHFYLKLGGFVFARKVSKEDMLSANINRMLRFSAPETLQNNAVAFYSYSSDIWSYGMVLDYIAHDGRNPFVGLNHRSRLRRALWESDRRPELRADLHPTLGVLIETCCRSERRDDDGRILPLQALRPTAVEIRQFLVEHQNEEDRLALLAVAQLYSVSNRSCCSFCKTPPKEPHADYCCGAIYCNTRVEEEFNNASNYLEINRRIIEHEGQQEQPPLPEQSLEPQLAIESATSSTSSVDRINIINSTTFELTLTKNCIALNEEQYVKNMLDQGHFVHMDDLRLSNKLGSGSYGMVFDAVYEPKRTTSEGAIPSKLAPEFAAKIWNNEANYREVYLLLKLRHDHLVRYITAIIAKGTLSGFLMERHEFTLETFLTDNDNKGSFDQFKFPWVTQLANVVDFLHDRGVILRDLKPSNLMLSKDMRLILIDLGMARLVNTVMTSCAGTFLFMAPEVCLEGAKTAPYCLKADVFSFGLVCLFIETEKNPFKHDAAICDADRAAYLIKVRELCNSLTELEPQSFIAKIVIESTRFDPKDRPTMKKINIILQDLHDGFVMTPYNILTGQVARALSYCHEAHNIVHRNCADVRIASGNLQIGQEGSEKKISCEERGRGGSSDQQGELCAEQLTEAKVETARTKY